MLQELFIKVIAMSLTAVPIILVVMLARMVLKAAPKMISYALWSVVLFRLLCPFSFEMSYSFVPEQIASGEVTESLTSLLLDESEINDGEIIVDETEPTDTVRQSLGSVFSIIWVGGIAVVAFYSVGLLMKLKSQLVSSMHYKGNVFLSDYIDFPFVLGIVKPKIYLPSTMPESDYAHTILHEMYHIARKDHIVKGLAFAALCIHWFNPLVWIAFLLAMTDMEMSCDEAIINQAGEGMKAEYSLSLLGFSSGKRYLPATFLAFGEVSPKARIKNVLKWKKSSLIFSVSAAVLAGIVGVICLSNPKEKTDLVRTEKLLYEDMTEAEAYDLLEERYFFRPVEFTYLPEGLVFESMEMNLKDRYTKLHYERSDGAWLDLYVAERYMATNPRFYFIVDGDLPHSKHVISYEVEAKERGTIQVSVGEHNVSSYLVIRSIFAGHLGEEYVINSYHIQTKEYDLILKNMRFSK